MTSSEAETTGNSVAAISATPMQQERVDRDLCERAEITVRAITPSSNHTTFRIVSNATF